MEFCGSDDLRKLLHIRRLDIHNIEALILDVQIPEVYTQIIATDERLPIAVDRDTVDVVSMSIGISPPRYGGDYCVVMCEAGKFQIGSRVEERRRHLSRRSSTSSQIRWCQIMGEVVLCHHLK